MMNGYTNWNAQSPKGTEMEVHKLRTQEMMHDTHNYYDPEVPNFNKNENAYYDQFEKKEPPFPWRRFFARGFDFSLYGIVFEAVAALGFGINILETTILEDFLSTVITLIVMLLVEPLFLSRFGTTPGKWIFGITVTDKKGQNLTYKDALERCFGVIRYGAGFHIPFYSLYRQYRSYQDCKENWPLEWESDSLIRLKENKIWQIPVFLVLNAVLVIITMSIYNLSFYPVNRGDITVEEFCENYNEFAKFYDIEDDLLLQDGTWQEKTEESSYTINLWGYEKPVIHFIEENGVMKGLEFEILKTNTDKNDVDLVAVYDREIFLSSIAFLRAQERYNPFTDQSDELVERLIGNLSEDSGWRSYDVDVYYEVEMNGYYFAEDAFISAGEGENSLRISFKMSK